MTISLTAVNSSTLTPMHLRKAKLMFFWVRYPSSAVLKMYFPDIKFNKNNTAQLVKWFSNFRWVMCNFELVIVRSTANSLLPLVHTRERLVSCVIFHRSLASIAREKLKILKISYEKTRHVRIWGKWLMFEQMNMLNWWRIIFWNLNFFIYAIKIFTYAIRVFSISLKSRIVFGAATAAEWITESTRTSGTVI